MVDFDNPKYNRPQRLRAFYAVPKMVVIPSSAALRKQKLQQLTERTPPIDSSRVALVRSPYMRVLSAVEQRFKYRNYSAARGRSTPSHLDSFG